MADGYFRAKHKVAPVMASVGPGVLHLLPALGIAMLDSSGVLVIPTGPPTHYLDKGSLEELSVHGGDDTPNMFRPITKRVWYAMRPDILAYRIMQAYKLAGTGRPGPTAVYIPFDVSSHEVEMDTSTWEKDHLTTRTGGDPEAIQEAARVFSQAKKPLLLVGGGADDKFLGTLKDGLPATFLANCEQAMRTGEPGFSFNFGNKQNETLRNACTEVVSADDSDVCNLGSVNLGAITSLDELRSMVALASKFLVCGTVRADLPYSKVAEVREKNRRLGLGLMGIHEWLLKKGKLYEVDDELRSWLVVYRDES